VLPLRRLGRSTLEVSGLSLGSWRSFERISRDDGIAIMEAARQAGINFLDDARYDDETGTAPLPTGWSEVIFGDLLRASGWNRDEVAVANKLWWEFYPSQSAAEELDGSLARMQFDHIDLIYSSTLPDTITVPEAVEAVAGLIATGKAREWAVVNWTGEQLAAALDHAASHGLPAPCAAQLAYSLVQREPVENPATEAALRRGVGLIPSAVLAGGALTGKYVGGASGRLDRVDPLSAPALRAGAALAELAGQAGVSPVTLALAFVWDHPATASVLLGATSAAQLRDNVQSFDAMPEVDPDLLARVIEATSGL
jgi:aryl-alcohol dehydrogenase-like predicted oxidoreductase